MKRIYKYPLEFVDDQVIMCHGDGEILSVQNQREILVVWILEDTKDPIEKRRFYIVGTGHPFLIDDVANYLGSVQFRNGDYVWHVFEGVVDGENI